MLVKAVAKIDLINDGTGYTLPPLIGISSAPSAGIQCNCCCNYDKSKWANWPINRPY